MNICSRIISIAKNNMFKIFVSLIILLLISNVECNNNITDHNMIVGKINLENKKFNNLSITGSLKFQNLYIEDLLQVTGKVEGTDLKCRNLKITGPLNAIQVNIEDVLQVVGNVYIEKVNIIGTLNVIGSLQIKDGIINNIKFNSQKATFLNSNIGNIISKKCNDHKISVIELKNSTKVNGDIIFENEGSEVHIFDSSSVIGQILGGKLIRK